MTSCVRKSNVLTNRERAVPWPSEARRCIIGAWEEATRCRRSTPTLVSGLQLDLVFCCSGMFDSFNTGHFEGAIVSTKVHHFLTASSVTRCLMSKTHHGLAATKARTHPKWITLKIVQNGNLISYRSGIRPPFLT